MDPHAHPPAQTWLALVPGLPGSFAGQLPSFSLNTIDCHHCQLPPADKGMGNVLGGGDNSRGGRQDERLGQCRCGDESCPGCQGKEAENTRILPICDIPDSSQFQVEPQCTSKPRNKVLPLLGLLPSELMFKVSEAAEVQHVCSGLSQVGCQPGDVAPTSVLFLSGNMQCWAEGLNCLLTFC
jgi:hypothetical protein